MRAGLPDGQLVLQSAFRKAARMCGRRREGLEPSKAERMRKALGRPTRSRSAPLVADDRLGTRDPPCLLKTWSPTRGASPGRGTVQFYKPLQVT